MSKKVKSTATSTGLRGPVPENQVKHRLFQLTTKIVGKQYCDGHTNDGEVVCLERELTCPYDFNAIKVLNSSRVQVGYIAAWTGTAAVLAPIMDYRLKDGAGGNMEAVVREGSSNGYEAYVDIVIIGTIEHAKAIEERLQENQMQYQKASSLNVRAPLTAQDPTALRSILITPASRYIFPQAVPSKPKSSDIAYAFQKAPPPRSHVLMTTKNKD
jgi:hypothetical protein